MKKPFLNLLFSFFSTSLFALPIGNPATQNIFCDQQWGEGIDICSGLSHWDQIVSFSFGFYGDYVFQRHLSIDNGQGDPVIKKGQIFTNAGYLSVVFYDHLELFGTIGSSNIAFDSNIRAFDFGESGSYTLRTSSDFSWSLGGKFILIQWEGITIGIEGQFFSTNPHIQRVAIDQVMSSYPSGKFRLHYHEWQLAFAMSHQIFNFIPYVGVKYSHAHAHFNEPFLTSFLTEVVNDKHWGFAIGCSIIDCRNLSLTVEGRWSDETALFVNAQSWF